ncbi:hypothetical protein GGR53DRAFT_471488 [Hypoxylon sp. FL1150]|nr:hypothetical protein GGR53DRAFT_471488 [Hypoxylon sp. FL1150]
MASASAGTESGVINCYEPESALAVFTHNGADLELDGSGTAFSANLILSSDSTAGTDAIVGSGGSEHFFFHIHSLSGEEVGG